MLIRRFILFVAALCAVVGDVAAQSGPLSPSPASIIYAPPFGGARARTLQSRLSDEVWVTDFGFRCDGNAAAVTAAARLTSNDAALAAAVAYVGTLSGGATLRFPRGICTFKAGIDWPSAVPVGVKGEGPFLTFLVQYTGTNSNGAIRVTGTLDANIGGSVWWSKGPTGSISDLAVMSDSGPAIHFRGAGNMSVSNVWGVYAAAGHAILDINGGTINQYVNTWWGDSDLVFYPVLGTVAAGHPTEAYSIRAEPRDTVVSGQTVRFLLTEQQFSNYRVGWAATVAPIRFSNGDPSVYSSFGHMLSNGKFNCAKTASDEGVIADNVDLWMVNSVGESANAAGTCLSITGGNVSVMNSQLNAVTKTTRGATAINLKVSNSHVYSLNVASAPVDTLQFNNVTMTVEPSSVSGQFAATANGTKNFLWHGVNVDLKVHGVKDAVNGAGLLLESDGVYNVVPAYKLKSNNGGGVTAAYKQLGLTSGGLLQLYDVTNTANVALFNGNTVTFGTGALALGASKTLTASNTLTLAGTDGSTLNIGAGGTLGSNAFTSTAGLPLTGGTLTGNTSIIPSSSGVGLTLGAAGGNYASLLLNNSYIRADATNGILVNSNSDGLNLAQLTNAGAWRWHQYTTAGVLQNDVSGNITSQPTSGSGNVARVSGPAFTTPNIGAATGTSLAATGALTSSGTAGIGYATGAGGTVTQNTNKATAVTLDKTTGNITLNGAALAAATIVSFTLNNSTVAAQDLIACAHHSTGTTGAYTINCRATGAGTAAVDVRNNTAGSLSEAIVIKFAVIKGVTS